MLGAEEGTRTPTPLRVHGPEPCASANSATSARIASDQMMSPSGRTTSLFYKAPAWLVKHSLLANQEGATRAAPCRTSNPVTAL
jgi:hypothetical protein